MPVTCMSTIGISYGEVSKDFPGNGKHNGWVMSLPADNLDKSVHLDNQIQLTSVRNKSVASGVKKLVKVK